MNEYGIPAVAHLTAQYLDKDDVDEALDLFDQAKVSGVLALRGDRVEGAEPAGVFDHASDLAAYIREKRPNLKIYGACYPEKHPQAATLEEDIDNLKKKVDAGVSHLISQLFYDNEDFLRFVDKARAAGIDVPIEAGIMPVMNAKSVLRMSKMCESRVPEKLAVLLDKWGSDTALLKEAGIAYASEQICDFGGTRRRRRAPVHDEPSMRQPAHLVQRQTILRLIPDDATNTKGMVSGNCRKPSLSPYLRI